MMNSTFSLIIFDDGVYDCIKTIDIKKRNGRDITVKWKNCLYFARLLCTDTEATCRSLLRSLNNNIPYVKLQKLSMSLENLSSIDQDLNKGKDDNQNVFEDIELYSLTYQNDIQSVQEKLTPPEVQQTITQQPITSVINDTEDVELDYDSDDSVKDKDYVPISESDYSEDETDNLNNFGLLNDNVNGNITDIDVPVATSPDNIEVIRTSDHEYAVVDAAPVGVTDTSGYSGSSKRMHYPKKYNICTFCDKKITNIDRHFQRVHKNEPEVKRFLILPKLCPERRRIIGDLRKLGNFKFNKSRKEGDIFVARTQHKKKIAVSKYLPCPKCKVFITQASLRRHYRNCEPKRKGHNERNVLIASRAVLENIHSLANEILKKEVFPVIKEDLIKDLIRYDDLLILYGNTMCDKYRDEHHFDMIRSRLRTMAKFLSILKSLSESIDDLKSVFKPENFSLITQALHIIGDYDEKTGHFKKATLPSTVGTALKYIGKLYISQCIKHKNEEVKQEVENLMTLLRTDLESTVNKTSNESLLSRKRQKKVVLPDTKDIVKLTDYLQKNRDYYYNDIIKNGYSYKSWLQLSKFTLVSILVFNRKRPGELERAFVTDYKNFQRIEKDKNPEIYYSLPEEGKRAAHDYVRFSIRGKLARGVPVLLHINMKTCIDEILKHRKNAGVLPENPYIFALPQSKGGLNTNLKYIRAATLIRKYAEECNTRNPLSLRATQLRKHIATKSALLNLDKDKVHCLQNFLGHEERIHNQIYRQPLEHREIVNVSKLLEIGQGLNDDEDVTKTKVSPTATVTETTMEKSFEDSDLAIMNIANSDDSQNVGRLNDVEDITLKDLNTSPTATVTEITTENSLEDLDLEIMNTSSDDSPNVSSSEKRHSKRRYRLLDIDLGYVRRRTWSTPEKDETEKMFSHYIKTNTLPSTAACIKVLRSSKILKDRTTQQIRSWIQNQIKKKKDTKQFARRSWESPERVVLNREFSDYIQPDGVEYPSLKEIQEVINKFPELKNRTPAQIKSQIQYQRKLKNS